MPLDTQGIAARHGFSTDAVLAAWQALRCSGGNMAQFNHWELGGGGQWMPGMLMIGDMFNNNLKNRVDNLFQDLARQPVDPPPVMHTPIQPMPQQSPQQSPPWQSQQQGYSSGTTGASLSYGMLSSSGNWYPNELGSPSTNGSQNNVRYAYFPSTCRLAIELFGRVTIYDTGSHFISSVQQGQSNDAGSITFTSQYGMIPVASLPIMG